MKLPLIDYRTSAKDLEDFRILTWGSPQARWSSSDESVIRWIQVSNNLTVDGIVGPQTWPWILALSNVDAPIRDAGFDGDLNFLAHHEGYSGRPYLPCAKGARCRSGVTLDPGFDLGHQDSESLYKVYGIWLSTWDLSKLEEVLGLRGQKARTKLNQLKHIRIGRITARATLPHAALPYWQGIQYLEGLSSAPKPVQTALLSLAYNRGPRNRAIQRLRSSIKDGNWKHLSDQIFAMKKDHTEKGLRLRRESEARLILDHVVKENPK